MDNKQAFAALVEKEIRDIATKEEIKILESAPDQWRLCLLDLLKEVDLQLSKNQIDFKYVMDSEEEVKTSAQWRHKANCFKRNVIIRITSVKTLIKQKALLEIKERQEKAAANAPKREQINNMDDLCARIDILNAHLSKILETLNNIYSEIPQR